MLCQLSRSKSVFPNEECVIPLAEQEAGTVLDGSNRGTIGHWVALFFAAEIRQRVCICSKVFNGESLEQKEYEHSKAQIKRKISCVYHIF